MGGVLLAEPDLDRDGDRAEVDGPPAHRQDGVPGVPGARPLCEPLVEGAPVGGGEAGVLVHGQVARRAPGQHHPPHRVRVEPGEHLLRADRVLRHPGDQAPQFVGQGVGELRGGDLVGGRDERQRGDGAGRRAGEGEGGALRVAEHGGARSQSPHLGQLPYVGDEVGEVPVGRGRGDPQPGAVHRDQPHALRLDGPGPDPEPPAGSGPGREQHGQPVLGPPLGPAEHPPVGEEGGSETGGIIDEQTHPDIINEPTSPCTSFRPLGHVALSASLSEAAARRAHPTARERRTARPPDGAPVRKRPIRAPPTASRTTTPGSGPGTVSAPA